MGDGPSGAKTALMQNEMSREAQPAVTLLLCLACSKVIDAEELPRCVVHSCCSRPVCPACLTSRPRLATFCVRCEGVQHALRKGPRDDVTRAGQVVFDFDRSDSDTAGGDGQEHERTAPPAYSENALPADAFILGGDEEDGGQVVEQVSSAPSLLRSARMNGKPGPTKAAISSTYAASGLASESVSNSSEVTTALRDTLHRDNTRAADTSLSSPQRPPADPSSPAARLATQTTAPSTGLTRQYWLRPNDTLMSLSLRFRINAAALCKLNDLPSSTITTTPHLIHTRQFLLIPEEAIQSALESTSGDPSLESALQGPVPMSKQQKLGRARREAQSRFRALVAQGESRSRANGHGKPADVTPCDERAARAYITLMEAELRFVDFGDGIDVSEELADGSSSAVKRMTSSADKAHNADVVAGDDALIDAARQRRYDAIVKQALCRWEMDSDWERQQRAKGLEPNVTQIGPSQGSRGRRSGASSSQLPSWLRWLKPDEPRSDPSHRSDPKALPWMEKGH